MAELTGSTGKELVQQAALVALECAGALLAFKEAVVLGVAGSYGEQITLADPRVGRVVAGLATFGIAGIAFNQRALDQ